MVVIKKLPRQIHDYGAKFTGSYSHHDREVKVSPWEKITKALVQYKDVILSV